MPSETQHHRTAAKQLQLPSDAHAERFAPLIDGEEYFAAVRSSIIKAERQVLIVGWELHSEVALLRGVRAEEATETDGYPIVLTDLLQRLVEDRPQLHIHLLIWSGAALFALEREYLPRMKRPWEQHPRIRLEWAKDIPRLGSHHQKFVVIDDRVVFIGGMDLTKSRWDSHEHRIDEPRRRMPGLVPSYGEPYHDAMAVYDDEVAGVVGDLGRARWQQATSEQLEQPQNLSSSDRWPTGVEPLLRNRRVSLALTQPAYAGQRERRDVETSFVEQFRAAKRLIYIETQYLSASNLVDEIIDRLRDPEGPEVVIVLPFGCPGMLQSMALDHERDRLIEKLRAADTGERLGIYWPTLADGDTSHPFESSVYVHAKVLVIDDRIIRIGSANFNNRSMGLDTELDAWIEAEQDDDEARQAIAGFRRRSLSYLLGRSDEEIANVECERGTLVAAIEHLRGGERCLHPFEHSAPSYSQAAPLDLRLADPASPLPEIDVDEVLDAIDAHTGVAKRTRRARHRAIGWLRRHLRAVIIFVVFALGTAAIAFTSLPEMIASVDVQSHIRAVRDSPFGCIGVCVAIAVLGSVGVPITLLVASAGAILAPRWTVPISLLGVTGASLAGFAFGRFVPESPLQSHALRKLQSALRAFKKNGVLSVAVIRNLPIAPFVVVNAALGCTGLTWSAYLIGTVVGILPGVVLQSLFGRQLFDIFENPTAANIARLAGIVFAFCAVVIGTQKVWQRSVLRKSKEPERAK